MQPALNVSETETSVDTLSLLDWRRGAALVFGCEGEKDLVRPLVHLSLQVGRRSTKSGRRADEEREKGGGGGGG